MTAGNARRASLLSRVRRLRSASREMCIFYVLCDIGGLKIILVLYRYSEFRMVVSDSTLFYIVLESNCKIRSFGSVRKVATAMVMCLTMFKK